MGVVVCRTSYDDDLHWHFFPELIEKSITRKLINSFAIMLLHVQHKVEQ